MTGQARSVKDGAPSTNASIVNTLIASGKTRRATRSSTNFGESRGKTVSISIVGNGHPSKFIAIDRGMVGNHTACTKERFLIALDRASARHAALPQDTELPEGVKRFTWLPLTPQQASVFSWERFFEAPSQADEAGLEPDEGVDDVDEEDAVIQCMGPVHGYKIDLPDGTESRLRYVRCIFTGASAVI